MNFEHVEATSYDHISWPAKHPAAGLPIILRDYQVEVINRFLDNPQCLQEIATAAGKTLVTAVLSHKCEKFGRTIVIVPNKDLVVQTERDYKNLGLDVGVLYGDRKEYDKHHTICTWQSLAVLQKKTKEGSAEVELETFLNNVKIRDLPSFKISLFNSRTSEKIKSSNTLDRSVNFKTAYEFPLAVFLS